MKSRPKLGQNFLVDDRARFAIVEALGDISQRTVIEIGPGKGAITDILAERAESLIAIELDRNLAPMLRERFANNPCVRVIEEDFLKVDLHPLIRQGGTAHVIGNLPYYITSDILLKLFAAGADGLLDRAVVMMQREVADRVGASPGSRDYGLLSATAQLYARVETLFTLPPSAFSPPPMVYSTVLRLTFAPRSAELGVEGTDFPIFLKISFAQKRKTLENNLRVAGYSSEQLEQAWPTSIPRKIRAESLGLEGLALLYRSLSAPN